MFSRLATLVFACGLLLAAEALSLHAARAENGDCPCPIDNNGDEGVPINMYTSYQCAYPTDSCTWDVLTGTLLNDQPAGCPAADPCENDVCVCPVDKTGARGTLIDSSSTYQCAYTPGGACTWNIVTGALENIYQTNCPTEAPCNVASEAL